jgi:Family of unknown function (DUF6644)
MSILQVCEWLESSSIGIVVRESLWGFPMVVAVHILGLTVSVGLVIWFDLRLLGVTMPAVPVATVYRGLAPWMLSGFATMFVSGAVLFIAFATKAYGNAYFQIKLAAMLLAGMNALIFHYATERYIVEWNESARPPAGARLAGAISILAWTVVILAGRMMSYTMF